jgi:hypothetical protein
VHLDWHPILVSQTIGKVINGDEADITKLRGTSHSTPNYTSNVSSVNTTIDKSEYQQSDADEDSNINSESRQDKRTVNMLKTDTKVDERDANQDAREITNVLGEANNDLIEVWLCLLRLR